MRAKILINYKRLKDAHLPFFAFYVVESMKGNPVFPAPHPSLAEISELAKTYQRLLVASLDGGKTAVRLKNQQRDELEQALVSLSGYVQTKAGFDAAKLTSSGFDVTKPRKGARQDRLIIKTGKEKHATSISPRVLNAKVYIHQYTTLPVSDNSVWTEEISTSRKHIFTDLVPGKRYAFRVKVVASGNKQVMVDMVVKMVE